MPPKDKKPAQPSQRVLTVYELRDANGNLIARGSLYFCQSRLDAVHSLQYTMKPYHIEY